MIRAQILADAGHLINSVRAREYGDASEMHTRIAAIWSALLGHPVMPCQVALLMIGLKLARLAHSPQHKDSWVDAAAYAALGAELSIGEE